MTIRLLGEEYREEETAIIAAPPGVSTHAAGTWRAPCHHCGVACLINLANHLLRERAGTLVFCLPCAARHHPRAIVGSAGGRAVTLRQALDAGWLRLPEDGDGR